MTKSLILSFVFVSIIFLIIDVLWLSITVKILYKPALGNLINDKPVSASGENSIICVLY